MEFLIKGRWMIKNYNIPVYIFKKWWKMKKASTHRPPSWSPARRRRSPPRNRSRRPWGTSRGPGGSDGWRSRPGRCRPAGWCTGERQKQEQTKFYNLRRGITEDWQSLAKFQSTLSKSTKKIHFVYIFEAICVFDLFWSQDDLKTKIPAGSCTTKKDTGVRGRNNAHT